MQQLRAKTKSLTCPPLSITRYSFIQLSQLGLQWREQKCPIFEMVAKGDSNPGSLDCESGILPLSYRAPIHRFVEAISSTCNRSRCPDVYHDVATYLLVGVDCFARGDLLLYLRHLVGKQLAVLRALDGRDRRSENVHAVRVKDTVLLQLDAAVQGRLSPEVQQNATRALRLNHLSTDGKKSKV